MLSMHRSAGSTRAALKPPALRLAPCIAAPHPLTLRLSQCSCAHARAVRPWAASCSVSLTAFSGQMRSATKSSPTRASCGAVREDAGSHVTKGHITEARYGSSSSTACVLPTCKLSAQRRCDCWLRLTIGSKASRLATGSSTASAASTASSLTNTRIIWKDIVVGL